LFKKFWEIIPRFAFPEVTDFHPKVHHNFKPFELTCVQSVNHLP